MPKYTTKIGTKQPLRIMRTIPEQLYKLADEEVADLGAMTPVEVSGRYGTPTGYLPNGELLNFFARLDKDFKVSERQVKFAVEFWNHGEPRTAYFNAGYTFGTTQLGAFQKYKIKRVMAAKGTQFVFQYLRLLDVEHHMSTFEFTEADNILKLLHKAYLSATTVHEQLAALKEINKMLGYFKQQDAVKDRTKVNKLVTDVRAMSTEELVKHTSGEPVIRRVHHKRKDKG